MKKIKIQKNPVVPPEGQNLLVLDGEGGWYVIAADDATLRLIAEAIQRHFEAEAEVEETKQRAKLLQAAKQFAANCPNCDGDCYAGGSDAWAWDECPECVDYMKFIREAENG